MTFFNGRFLRSFLKNYVGFRVFRKVLLAAILLFLSSHAVLSKDIQAFKKCLETQHYRSVDSFNYSLGTSPFTAFVIDNKLIDSNFESCVIELNNHPSLQTSDSAAFTTYHCYLLLYQNQIIMCNLDSSHRNESKSTTIFSYSNDSLMKGYEELACEDCKEKKKNCFNIRLAYGKGCGMVGTPPVYRYLLQNCISNSDTFKLNAWLYSTNVAVQVYATEGFYTLKMQMKFKPSLAQLDRIKAIKKSNRYAAACFGCIYTAEKVSVLTKKFRF